MIACRLADLGGADCGGFEKMTAVTTLANPGKLSVSCLDCHYNTTMPAALLPRFAAEMPFPDVWGGFRYSACGSRYVDVRPNWADRQAAGQVNWP